MRRCCPGSNPLLTRQVQNRAWSPSRAENQQLSCEHPITSKLVPLRRASIPKEKGDEMAEASRKDNPLKNPKYPQGASSPPENSTALSAPNEQQLPSPENTLPPGDIYGQPPLRRSAEVIGRGIGSAVAGVRQFPRSTEEVRSRLRDAGARTRANASAIVLDFMDSAARRTEDLRRSTQETVSDWADTAGSTAAELGDRADAVWRNIRSTAVNRAEYARRRATARWNDARRALAQLQREDPAMFLAVVAGAAFVVGAGMRIWRSNHD